MNDIQSQERYKTSLQSSDFLTVKGISRDTLIKASELRARYKNKLPDSIHLASAIEQHCDWYIGNDKKIKTGEEIQLGFL